MEYRDAFFWMGAATSAISTLTSLVWIKGYEGLFFQKRVMPNPQNRPEKTSTPDTQDVQAQGENFRNRSQITESLSR